MLSNREKLVLDIIREKEQVADIRYIKDAKRELKEEGISLSTAYKIVERAAKKGSEWRIGVNQVLGYRRSSPILNKHLKFSE